LSLCRFLQGLARHHERGETALHVGYAETLDLVTNDATAQFGVRLDVEHHAEIFTRAGGNLVSGVAVEAENVPVPSPLRMPTALGRSTSTSCRTLSVH